MNLRYWPGEPPRKWQLTRRELLRHLALAGAAVTLRPRLGAAAVETDRPTRWDWLNQSSGTRPRFVWENREDIIYHDLSYSDKTLESAPEIAPFMGRRWVFNRAMTWHREAEGIVCYSTPATLWLTGVDAVSAWHSDNANELTQEGQWTLFCKRSTVRRRDCAVLPAFQFHLGQNPACELEVAESSDDWQFVVSVKGRSGPPLLASEWRSGPAVMAFDLADALQRKGFDLHYAELHFVIGLWAKSAEAPSSIRFKLRLPGHPAVVASLPVVRTAQTARAAGVPVVAVALDAQGQPLGRENVRLYAALRGERVAMEERVGLWRATLPGLPAGDYPVRIEATGELNATTVLPIRVTDGQFWGLDNRRLLARTGRIGGPLSGSYQGNVFVRDAGTDREALVQGQEAWDQWDRTKEPGEHLFYWEALSAAEMDQRFAYLAECGWDLLHVCQHWGIWERLDAGGRIAPHGAEQMALYLRTAARHGLGVIQALTHYEYLSATSNWHGTVPFTAYLEAGFQSEDFITPGRNPHFETMFRRYLLDYVSLFRDETALFAMTASGEGDATIGHPRAHDVFDFVRAHDPNHMFFGEPTLILRKSPRQYTRGWRQDLFGGRTYAIADHFHPEYDLGVEFKLYQLGGLAMAEGSWGTSGLYADFHREVLKDGGYSSGTWVGTDRYRLRLRDSLYLGLIHRLPMMMTWDEQIAENEHQLIREIRRRVDWQQPFARPPVAVRLASDDLSIDHRQVLVQYQEALNKLRLDYEFLYHDDPAPESAEVVFDAAQAFRGPAFVSEGGSLPEKLKASIPLQVSSAYAVWYAVTDNRTTLLAYLCNNADYAQIPFPLAGRFHRKPLAVPLDLQIQNLAAGPLRLRIYNLNLRRLIQEKPMKGRARLELGPTDADYFVLVTPDAHE